MKRLRSLVALLVAWLVLFYTVWRWSEPDNIAYAVYIFAPLMAIFTILIPRQRQVPLGVLLAGPIPMFLALKMLMGGQVWGAAIPPTIAEICIIVLTTLLAHWVSEAMDEFENALVHITIGPLDRLPESFSSGLAQMYREMKRARRYQRPLALIAIGLGTESLQVALDRVVAEVQQTMMKQYVLSDIARTLCDELEDYHIIAQSNDYFLVLLPETPSEQLANLVGQLQQVVADRVGVPLRIGSASFPQDAVTFERLVEMAIDKMEEESNW